MTPAAHWLGSNMRIFAQPFIDAGYYLGGLMQGTEKFRPNDALQHGVELAMALAGPRFVRGRLPKATPTVDELIRSRSVRPPMFDPPVKPPRPFEADYPFELSPDPSGKLRADIEGRSLIADRIVGRRTLGGVDESLTPAEIEEVAAQLLTSPIKEVGVKEMGGNYLGRYDVDRAGNRTIKILKTAAPELKPRLKAHEVGHLFDDLGGALTGYDHVGPVRSIPQRGISDELSQVYHALNTGEESKARLFGPTRRGYKGDEIQRELMAEAIRAYLTNPNYFKTVAPKTAAAIRASVNLNPAFARKIQFNSFLGAGLAGGALANNGLTDPELRDIVVGSEGEP